MDSNSGKERFFRALRGEELDRTPVFPLLMHLAANRAGITYREFARNGRSLAEAQLAMLDRYPLDAITACSDAFRVSADLGGEMVYPENSPPHLARPLVVTEQDISALKRPDADRGRMRDRSDAIRIMAESAGDRAAVLGWVDMPYAEASSVTGVADFMMMAVTDPDSAHRLLRFLTDIVIDFALAQVEAGADMIGAGDAATSLVSPAMYREFALPYEQQVIEAVHAAGKTVKLHICGNTENHLPFLPESGADLFNVDHMVSFTHARDTYTGVGKSFKGNLDPVEDMLNSTPEACEAKAHELIRLASTPYYMLSAGCEIPSAIDDAVFSAFCHAPQTYLKPS
jgi:MtaA/CmuA family methyltransferase